MPNSVKLVTLDGECFEADFQRKEVAANRDGVFYLFHLTDLTKSRGKRLVSLFMSGIARLGIQNYDGRIESVRLNAIRRNFDSRTLSFDAPHDEHAYKEYMLDTVDFQEHGLKDDREIRQYLIHKTYWLGYRYPMDAVRSDVLYPIQFDEPIDLDYLGATTGDLIRNVKRLGNQGLLEKVMEGFGRPSEKLLAAYESGDFAALGITQQASASVPVPRVYDDYVFAKLALEEARKSVPEPDGRPHPKVGAIVVKNGQVLSSAYRGEAVGNHAEFIALEKKLADSPVAGATVYTTLEPCTTRNHPKIPCAERLIERRVARVVIGMLDPDPRITGRGQRKLRSANIVTDFFPPDLMVEVEELNREFTRHCEREVGDKQPSSTESPSIQLLAARLSSVGEGIDALHDGLRAIQSPLLPCGLFLTLQMEAHDDDLKRVFGEQRGYRSYGPRAPMPPPPMGLPPGVRDGRLFSPNGYLDYREGVVKAAGVFRRGHPEYNILHRDVVDTVCRFDEDACSRPLSVNEPLFCTPFVTLEIYTAGTPKSPNAPPSLVLKSNANTAPGVVGAFAIDNTVLVDHALGSLAVSPPDATGYTSSSLNGAFVRLTIDFFFLKGLASLPKESWPKLHNLQLWFGGTARQFLTFRTEELNGQITRENPKPIARGDALIPQILFEYEISPEVFTKNFFSLG